MGLYLGGGRESLALARSAKLKKNSLAKPLGFFFWLQIFQGVQSAGRVLHCCLHHICVFLVTVRIPTLVINLVAQRQPICNCSTMAPPSCHCPGLPFLQWPSTSPSPPTQVQQSPQDRPMRRLQISHFIFTSYRKPNNSCLCYISQPSWVLGLLHHVTAVLVPQPILDVLPAWARRSPPAVERPAGETRSRCGTYRTNKQNPLFTFRGQAAHPCCSGSPTLLLFLLQNPCHLETICWRWHCPANGPVSHHCGFGLV